MSEDWAAVSADVAAALLEVGFAATLQRPDTGPITPSDQTPITAGAQIAVTLVQSKWTAAHIDGTLIQATDKRFLMAATVAPTQADRIIIGAETFRIINVTPTAPGGVAVLYVVQARK